MATNVTMDFPGVDFVEKDFDRGARQISGVSTDVAGMLIIAEKGPIGVPTMCTSKEQAFDIFGSYINGSYGAYAIAGFFDNGGRELWITRTAHYADITDADTLMAKIAYTDQIKNRDDDPQTAFNVESLWHGKDGNNIAVKIIDDPLVQTTLADNISSGETVLRLTSMKNIAIGETIALKYQDDDYTEYHTIIAMDYAEKTITLANPVEMDFVAESLVTSCEFKIIVYYKTLTGLVIKEQFSELTMNTSDTRYAPTIVNSGSGSKYIHLVDMFASTDLYKKIPAAMNAPVYLTGGDDGIADITENDFVGSPIAKTGLYSFDNYDGMISICCPEVDSIRMNRAGFDYAESRRNAIYVGYIPSGLKPADAAEYRDEAGWSTTFGALYYNWGYVNDPIGIGDAPEKLIPLQGHILGAWARNDKENGYGSTPAGEDMRLIGVNSLEFTVDKTNGGILYGNRNRNINPIINLSGNGGITIWGGRLQESNDNRWFNIMTRRIFIYVEESFVRGTRWAAFKNKNDMLYNAITRVGTSFLTKVQGLSGETNAERFAILCDSTINNNDKTDPYVYARIGLNVEGVGEFIFFEVGQAAEGTSLAEI